MVGLSRIWLSLGLVVSLMAALLLGLPSPAGAVAGYGDVDEGTWYTDAVQWSVDNGIAGIAGTCFAPETPVSRGETAVWIHNMEGRPDAGVRHSFTDVTDASQNDAISWMANEEITTGKSPTTFAPDDTLTRAEAATFLHRLEGEPAAPAHSFVDVVKGWQQDSVSWMSHTGITTGTSPTTFAPDTTLTRAHLVTFLYRYQDEPDVTVNTSTPICDPAGDAETVEQYQPGDTIAGFPSGFAAVSGNFSGASVVITGGGSTVTVEITSNGSAAYSDTTYTCESVGGCTIVNGRVTKGTVNATPVTVGAAPTPDLVVDSPTVEPLAGTTTELVARFEDTIGVGETWAYDFAIRTKAPQGAWVEACKTFVNRSGRATTATFSQGFTGLEAGTTYEIRYRYRNSSQCGGGSPNEWSPVAQGTTNDDEAPAGLAPEDGAAFDARFVGSRLMARDAGFFVDFTSNGRIMESGRLPGSYRYSSIDPNSGTLTLTYDGGDYGGSCTISLTFDSATTGTLRYACASGIQGQGNWQIEQP